MTTTATHPPLSPDELARCLRAGRHPHDLVKTVAGVLWECISYPYPHAGTAYVMIRVPGDPTTMRAVAASYVRPEPGRCACAAAGEYWFEETPDRAQLRALEVERWERAGVTGS